MWNGFEINSSCLACGIDAPEVEIATRDGASHWTILIPLEKLLGFIDEESGAGLRRLNYVLRCPVRYSQRLKDLICKIVDANEFARPEDQSPIVISSIEYEILSSVEALLAYADNGSQAMSIRKRYAIYRRALQFAKNVEHRVSVEELANTLGVSIRVLQLCFRENIGISPRRFLIQMRLNHLHLDLRRGRVASTSVTQVMQERGISEYGRAAGEYKKLFGEYPSGTLAADHQQPDLRFIDVLNSVSI